MADWSPQEIAGRLWIDYPNSAHIRINPQTIYQWIFPDTGRGGNLYAHLRRRHEQMRYGSGRGLMPGRISIPERLAQAIFFKKNKCNSSPAENI